MDTETTDPQLPMVPEDYFARDWFLQDLVKMANRGGFGMSLSVGGVVISGEIIDGRTYFEEISKSFSSQMNETEDRVGITEFFEGYASIYDKPEEPDDDHPPLAPAYIHLRDARHFVPGQIPMPDNGVLWRGKIASVDGFTIGTMAKSEPSKR